MGRKRTEIVEWRELAEKLDGVASMQDGYWPEVESWDWADWSAETERQHLWRAVEALCAVVAR